ncbi:hypothetical protein L209DRAFT_577628 [Thermothelomyces heterothallicus CBS 203.75]
MPRAPISLVTKVSRAPRGLSGSLQKEMLPEIGLGSRAPLLLVPSEPLLRASRASPQADHRVGCLVLLEPLCVIARLHPGPWPSPFFSASTPECIPITPSHPFESNSSAREPSEPILFLACTSHLFRTRSLSLSAQTTSGPRLVFWFGSSLPPQSSRDVSIAARSELQQIAR